MRRPGYLGLLLLALALDASAQTTTVEEAYPDKYPPALPERKGPPPPRFVFERLGQIDLPGPLPDGRLELVDGRIRLAVAGGVAWMTPDPGSAATITGENPEESPNTAEPAPATMGWVVAPDGEMRFGIDAEGRIVGQRLSSLSKGKWKKEWMIRSPRATKTPPLLVGPRLFYTGVDDRIYAVRASNGHRLWAIDVGEPVSRPLVWWRCSVPVMDPMLQRPLPVFIDILLLVPDGGGALVAYDLYDGAALGRFVLPADQGWLTTPPAVIDDTRVVVARQGYVPEEAGLEIFALQPPPAPNPPAAAADTPTTEAVAPSNDVP